MLIIYGQEVKRRVSGYVADYCPVCCDIVRVVVKDVRVVPHLFFIFEDTSSASATTEFQCEACSTLLLSPTTLKRICDSRNLKLDDLIKETNPDIASIHEDYLNLDPENTSNSSSAPARKELAISALIAIDRTIACRVGYARNEVWSWFILLLLIGIPIAIFLGGSTESGIWRPNSLFAVVFASICLGPLAAFVLFATRISPIIRYQTRKVLRRVIGRLRLTREEYVLSLIEVHKVGCGLGRCYSSPRSWKRLMNCD